MMYCNEENRRKFWIKRVPFILLAITAGILLFGWLVMLLWNYTLPYVFGVAAITFWQALGILVLAKILFGGFRCGHGHGHMWYNHEFRNKWMHLSPEEREKMKEEWRSRCRTRVPEE
jgi:Ca2+/H+ antiporter, TMEM165/GDT1 family